jgi:hypothetical protein
MTPEKAKGPAADRAPSATTRPNQAPSYMTRGHESRMQSLAARLSWLEHHEHWWARQLRWSRLTASGTAA